MINISKADGLDLSKYSNSTMCTDGELVRVGFMSPNAVQEYVESLEAGGLQFKEEKKFLGVFGKA